MTGFFTTVGPARVGKMSPLRLKRILGVMVEDAFVQPPKCEFCGGHLELGEDWVEGLVSCQDCGKEVRIFHYEKCPIKA